MSSLLSNIASLQTQRGLSANATEANQSIKRLSSGLRINSASDDAAGLAVAASLNVDTKIYNQALRNVNDGLSALSIAEQSMNELATITLRQKELAQQAANGVLSLAQRRKIEEEAKALTNEYNRIVNTASFNGQQLLASSNVLSIQTGVGTSAALTLSLGEKLQGTTTGSAQATSTATITGPLNEISQVSLEAYRGEISEYTYIHFSEVAGNYCTDGGAAEQMQINVGTDGSSIDYSDYFTIYTSGGSYYGYFVVDGNWYDPGGQSGTGVPIYINSSDSADTIAGQISSALGSCGANWSVWSSGSSVYISNNEYGDVNNPGSSGDISAWTTADGSSSWTTFSGNYCDGSKVQLYTASGQGFYFWFNVDGMWSNPGGDGIGQEITLTATSSGDDVANAFASALSNTGEFNYNVSSNSVDMHAFDPGNTPNATSSSMGGSFTMNICDGSSNSQPTLSGGEYFTFTDGAASYAVWYNRDGATTMPSNLCGYSTIEIACNWSSTIEQVAASTTAAINALTYVDASLSGTNITITNTIGRPSTDIDLSGISLATGGVIQQGTSSAAVNVGSDVFTLAAHGYTTGQRVRLSSTGTLPGGLAPNTDYYVINAGANFFRLATSAANATANSYINLTSQGIGTFTVTAYSNVQTVEQTTTISQLDLSTSANARSALPVLDQQLSRITSERGSVGSAQSRLENVSNVLSAARENYAAAESGIRSVDTAGEAANLLSATTKRNAAVALLAQANQQPQLALRLLQDLG